MCDSANEQLCQGTERYILEALIFVIKAMFELQKLKGNDKNTQPFSGNCPLEFEENFIRFFLQ